MGVGVGVCGCGCVHIVSYILCVGHTRGSGGGGGHVGGEAPILHAEWGSGSTGTGVLHSATDEVHCQATGYDCTQCAWRQWNPSNQDTLKWGHLDKQDTLGCSNTLFVYVTTPEIRTPH